MTEAELDEAAGEIALAFLHYDGERGSGGIFPTLNITPARLKRYMKAVLRYAMKTDQLFAVSEKGEGYAVKCESFEEKEPLFDSFLLFWGECLALGFGAFAQYSAMFMNAGESEESRWRREKRNYISVSLLAVREAYQHQGYMRRMLEDIFAEADEKQLAVLLETDAESKMLRYCHLGMECTGKRDMGFGCTYYHLIRHPADPGQNNGGETKL